MDSQCTVFHPSEYGNPSSELFSEVRALRRAKTIDMRQQSCGRLRVLVSGSSVTAARIAESFTAWRHPNRHSSSKIMSERANHR